MSMQRRRSPLRRTISRRDFLNGVLVGASGLALGDLLPGCGGGAPPVTGKGEDYSICHAVRDGQTWTLPAASGELLDCVIIGAGVSGLVAARKLMLLGVDKLLVLEKEPEAGGQARQDGAPPKVYSQAVAYSVYPYNDNLVEVYQDLGVVTGLDAEGAAIVDDKYLVKSPINSSIIDGKVYSDSWEAGMDKLPYSAEQIADLESFREKMKEFYDYIGADGKLGFDTPTDASTTDAELRALDAITLSDWVKAQGWDPVASEFWDPYCRSSLGTTHDRISAWAAISFLGAEFFPTLSQPGGNAYLTRGLSGKLGAVVKTGTFVVRAVNQGSEVHVSYLEGGKVTTVRARTAIYAAPIFLAKHVLPEMVPAGRTEASAFIHTPYIVANLHVDRTPAGLGYDTWIHDGLFFTDVIVADWAGLTAPQSASLDRANVLTLYAPLFGSGRRSELLTRPLEEYETAILDDLEKILPGVTDTVTAVDLYRWGHAMLAPEKGFVFGASRLASQEPIGKISFAGHDVDGVAAFENAVGAAYRAVSEVGAHLGI